MSQEREHISTFLGSLKRYDIPYRCTLAALLDQLDDIVGDVDHDEIIVEWTDGNDCDSGYIEFTHRRLETDAEFEKRCMRDERIARFNKLQGERAAVQRTIDEIELLKKLQAKYGTDPSVPLSSDQEGERAELAEAEQMHTHFIGHALADRP